ncbi:MAG: metallophosphoesterase family protein [Gemmatimonadales bacterium]|nr:metallophosphoesterase family protein [Gemmatimonadales bacterium]
MPSCLIVLSDAHLDDGRAATEPLLLSFLARASDVGDALLINGDLFDFWFGYPTHRFPHGRAVLAALGALARRLPVTFVGGNHDRWGSPAWAEELGLRWFARSARLAVGARPVFAHHGDAIGTGRADRLRQTIVAHPLTSATFALLPPALGYRVVRALDGALANPKDDARVAAVSATQQAWADRTLASEPPGTVLVTGHSHLPVLRHLADGRVHANPGAFYDGGRYLTVTETAVTLHRA